MLLISPSFVFCSYLIKIFLMFRLFWVRNCLNEMLYSFCQLQHMMVFKLFVEGKCFIFFHLLLDLRLCTQIESFEVLFFLKAQKTLPLES